MEPDRIDFPLLDELDDIQRLFRLELDGLDLVGFEQHIFSALQLEALHDLVGVHGADTWYHPLVADALARGLVDLVEGDARAAVGRGIELDRHRNQRDPQCA